MNSDIPFYRLVYGKWNYALLLLKLHFLDWECINDNFFLTEDPKVI